MATFNEKDFIRDVFESEKYKHILKKRKEEIQRKLEEDKTQIKQKKEALLKNAKNEYESSINTIDESLPYDIKYEDVPNGQLSKWEGYIDISEDFYDTNTYKYYSRKVENSLEEAYEKTFLAALSAPIIMIIYIVLGIAFGLICKFYFLLNFWASFFISELLIALLAYTIAFIISYKNHPNKVRQLEREYNEKKNIKLEAIKKVNDQKQYNINNKNNYEANITRIVENTEKELEIYAETQGAIYNAEINEIDNSLNIVSKTIEELYALRVNDVLCLHPSYQGLLPVSVIYGYFDTGRCNKLAGADGAYNLYEDEKFKGMLLNKLDVISVQLNSLNRTMYYTGLAIQECNNKLTQLNNSTNKMIDSLSNMNENVLLLDDKISENDLKRTQEIEKLLKTNENIAYYAKTNAKINALNAMYNSGKDKLSFDTDMRTYRNVWIENYQ